MMYACHSWRDALNIATGKAVATGKRQRVRWNAEHLLWTVREVDRRAVA